MKKLSRFVLIVLAMCIYACSTDNLDEKADFVNINPAGWAYGDTIKFSYGESSDSLPVRLVLAVRHTSSYKYANLWLEMTVPTFDSLYVDTLNIRLSDRYGRPLGRGGGVSFIKTDTLPRQYVLDNENPIKVRHIMRVDTIKDIEQLGIMVIK